MAISTKMGACPPFMAYGASTTTVSGTTTLLDANFVNATSGKCIAMRFISPVSQSSAAFTFYAFMTTKAASPTDIRVAVFAGPSGAMDDDRPDTGAALGTSAAVDVSAQTNNTWTTFTISSLSLTAGLTYWAVLYNNTGTPGTNTATYMTRGLATGLTQSGRFPCYNTTDGFTTDPTAVAGTADAPFVMKFSDGSLVGMPYVVSTSHANNTNDRGMRFTFDADTTVLGIYVGGTIGTTSSTVKVYVGASEVATTPTLDKSIINNNGMIYFSSPYTFPAATAVDVVVKYGSSATTFPTIGEGSSAPSDVTACLLAGVSYVDGATPGSYTATAGAITGFYLILDNIPAASGGNSYTGMMLV